MELFRLNTFRIALENPGLPHMLGPPGNLLRSVEISFSLANLQTAHHLICHDRMGFRFPRPGRSFAATADANPVRLATIAAAHDCLVELLQRIWNPRGFGSPLQDLRIHHLRVDVSDCYCPLSCCRLAVNAMRTLGPWAGMPPKYLEVMGAQHSEEEGQIRKAIEQACGEKASAVRLSFVRDSGM
jgi:hypothetical protein